MSLDKAQVQHIAMLARLKLTDDEYAESVEKLSKIVDFVDQLSAADTDDVVPMAHPLDAAQRLRPDAVTESNNRDHYQENAADVSDGFYLVPKVCCGILSGDAGACHDRRREQKKRCLSFSLTVGLRSNCDGAANGLDAVAQRGKSEQECLGEE